MTPCNLRHWASSAPFGANGPASHQHCHCLQRSMNNDASKHFNWVLGKSALRIDGRKASDKCDSESSSNSRITLEGKKTAGRHRSVVIASFSGSDRPVLCQSALKSSLSGNHHLLLTLSFSPISPFSAADALNNGLGAEISCFCEQISVSNSLFFCSLALCPSPAVQFMTTQRQH